MKHDFYCCNHCGNLAAMLCDKGVPMFCCGEPMRKLLPAAA